MPQIPQQQSQIVCPFGTTVEPPAPRSVVLPGRADEQAQPKVHFAPCVGPNCALFHPGMRACAIGIAGVALFNIDRALTQIAEKIAPPQSPPSKA
jgi:hypothetical protein